MSWITDHLNPFKIIKNIIGDFKRVVNIVKDVWHSKIGKIVIIAAAIYTGAALFAYAGAAGTMSMATAFSPTTVGTVLTGGQLATGAAQTVVGGGTGALNAGGGFALTGGSATTAAEAALGASTTGIETAGLGSAVAAGAPTALGAAAPAVMAAAPPAAAPGFLSQMGAGLGKLGSAAAGYTSTAGGGMLGYGALQMVGGALAAKNTPSEAETLRETLQARQDANRGLMPARPIIPTSSEGADRATPQVQAPSVEQYLALMRQNQTNTAGVVQPTAPRGAGLLAQSQAPPPREPGAY